MWQKVGTGLSGIQNIE